MKIPLRKVLELAVGPANVDAAGHAVADWFDGRNCSGAADLIREQLQDQLAGDAVPHNRPDTSLRAELLHKLATQREVILSLCDRVDRLEMRADGLTPIERVQRRWAKESAGGDKLDRQAAGPAVPDDREPAAVAGEPSDRDLRQLYADTFDLRSDPASLGPAIVKFARAVLARWGRQPAPVPVSERLPGPEDMTEDGQVWIAYPGQKYPLGDTGCWENPHKWLLRPIGKFDLHWLPATALPLPAGEGQTTPTNHPTNETP